MKQHLERMATTTTNNIKRIKTTTTTTTTSTITNSCHHVEIVLLVVVFLLVVVVIPQPVVTAFPSQSQTMAAAFHVPTTTTTARRKTTRKNSITTTTTTTTTTSSSRFSTTHVLFASSSSSSSSNENQEMVMNELVEDNDNELGLTSELLKITHAFETIGDDKLRYKQLLYMANQLTPLDITKMIPENKVIGCLSNVYIDGKVVVVVPTDNDDNDKDNDNKDNDNNKMELTIEYVGDSDGLLTKGLVALLIRGLNHNTVQQIQAINPAFIQKAGIQSSLTPGRNNGFLNMLIFMKQKALQLEQEYYYNQQLEETNNNNNQKNIDDNNNDNDETTTQDNIVVNGNGIELTTTNDQPIYKAMIQALQKLQPLVLELNNVSHKHAGHVGMMKKGGKDSTTNTTESHFELYIVSNAFHGLKLLQRHQLIYMLLGNEIMSQIHALQIIGTQTRTEAETKPK